MAGAMYADDPMGDVAGPAVGSSGSSDIVPSPVAASTAVVARRRHVGLDNLGNTCYMNSLLQTLYMTPEFRRVLYMWRKEDAPSGDEESSSIPHQLQLLFAHLQLSRSRSVSTKALTVSFGWSSSESFQQHDVQELSRVLFDALEDSLAGTPNSHVMQNLFKGTLRDFVRCTVCGKERGHCDIALDLSLVVQPFGETRTMGSVEEALGEFVKEEVMEGENSVMCEPCGIKTKSVKGLAIVEPPYLLQLQVKRFVFNPESMAREKLNDRVTYPLLLNLNPFVASTAAAARAASQAAAEAAAEAEVAAEAAAAAALPAVATSSEASAAAAFGGAAASSSSMEEGSWGDCFDVAAAAAAAKAPASSDTSPALHERALAMIAEQGPHVYELYAVLVHSGGAAAGHYYAYIKDLDELAWYNFNDSSVSPVDVNTVLEAAGSEIKSRWGSSANAYMLLYRKVIAGDAVDIVAKDDDAAAAAPAAPTAEGSAATSSAGEVASTTDGASSSGKNDEGGEGLSEGAAAAAAGRATASGGASAPSATSGRGPTMISISRKLECEDELPPYARAAVLATVEADAKRDEEVAARRDAVTIKVFFRGITRSITASKTSMLRDVTAQAYMALGLSRLQWDGLEGVQDASLDTRTTRSLSRMGGGGGGGSQVSGYSSHNSLPPLIGHLDTTSGSSASAFNSHTSSMKSTSASVTVGEDEAFDAAVVASRAGLTPREGIPLTAQAHHGVTAEGIPTDCIRLREYDTYTNVVKQPWTYNLRPVQPVPPLPRQPVAHVYTAAAASDAAAAVAASVAGMGLEPSADLVHEVAHSSGHDDDVSGVSPVALNAETAAPSLSDGSERPLSSVTGSRLYSEAIVEVRSSPLVPWPESSWTPMTLNVILSVYDATTDELVPIPRIFVPRDTTLCALSAAIARATNIPRSRQRLLRIDRVYGGPEAYEFLTNVAMGIAPARLPSEYDSAADGGEGASSPRSDALPYNAMGALVGDSLRLRSDQLLHSFDTVEVHVEDVDRGELTAGAAEEEFDPDFSSHAGGAGASSTLSSLPTMMSATDGGGSGSAESVDLPRPLPVADVIVTSSRNMKPVSYGSSSSSSSYTYNSYGGDRRGLRRVTAIDSRCLRLSERLAFSRSVIISPSGSKETKTIQLDSRATGNEVYEAVSSAIGVPVGQFYIVRDYKKLRRGDKIGGLGYINNSLTTINLSTHPGPSLHEEEMLLNMHVRAFDDNVVPGFAWLYDIAAGTATPEAIAQALEGWMPKPYTVAERSAHAEALALEASTAAAAAAASAAATAAAAGAGASPLTDSSVSTVSPTQASPVSQTEGLIIQPATFSGTVDTSGRQNDNTCLAVVAVGPVISEDDNANTKAAAISKHRAAIALNGGLAAAAAAAGKARSKLVESKKQTSPTIDTSDVNPASLFGDDDDTFQSSANETGASETPDVPPAPNCSKRLCLVLTGPTTTADDLRGQALPALARMGLVPDLEQLLLQDGDEDAIAALRKRVRVSDFDVSANCPGTPLAGSTLLRKAIANLYETTAMVVQVVPSPETLALALRHPPTATPAERALSEAGQVPASSEPYFPRSLVPTLYVVYVQWFDRSRWEVGKRREVVISDVEDLVSFVKRLVSILPQILTARATTLSTFLEDDVTQAPAGAAAVRASANVPLDGMGAATPETATSPPPPDCEQASLDAFVRDLRYYVVARTAAYPPRDNTYSMYSEYRFPKPSELSVVSWKPITDLPIYQSRGVPPLVRELYNIRSGATLMLSDEGVPLRRLTVAEQVQRGIITEAASSAAAAASAAAGAGAGSARPQAPLASLFAARKEKGIKIMTRKDKADAAAAAAAAGGGGGGSGVYTDAGHGGGASSLPPLLADDSSSTSSSAARGASTSTLNPLFSRGGGTSQRGGGGRGVAFTIDMSTTTPAHSEEVIMRGGASSLFEDV